MRILVLLSMLCLCLPLQANAAQAEEETPDWIGTYKNGQHQLNIVNLRQGPGGLFFLYGFQCGKAPANPDDNPLEGTAGVEGREASYMCFNFELSKDAKRVRVTVDKDAANPQFCEPCTGDYLRTE